MIRHMKSKTAVACSLLATSLSSLAAVSTSPATRDDSPSRVVKFADLDLTHPQGAATLYKRITSAAREVCVPENNWMMELHEISEQCRRQAIARAVGEVNAPALTAYYQERMAKR